MESASSFDEDEIRLLLGGGTDQEINDGLALIDKHLRLLICGRLRRFHPGLNSTQIADIWQDCITGIWKAVKKGDFDLDRPLLPWIWTVANRRKIDGSRRQTSYQRLLDGVARALADTNLGRTWGRLAPTERREVMEQIQSAIATLPPQQRVVMQAFKDHFPESQAMETLRLWASEAAGVELTLASVKRALQEARQKVRKILARKGYSHDEKGEEYVRL